MIGRPLTLSILSHPIAVEWVEVIHVDEDEEPNAGVYDGDMSTIAIATGLSEAMQQETLLHETLHVLFDKTGLQRDLGAQGEGVVERLAPALLSAMRENRHLVHYLLDGTV